MKEIKAIIRSARLLKVIEELKKIEGLPGVTISEVIGFGKNKGAANLLHQGIAEIPNSAGWNFGSKLELIVPDIFSSRVIDVIQEYAHTGKSGDGIIVVTDVTTVIQISTKEVTTESLIGELA